MSGLDEILGDDAWISAMCTVEGALAMACADAGLIDRTDAEEVRRTCETVSIDPVSLGAEAAEAGNPVLGVVHRIRAATSAPPSAVHRGATSQDIIDNAMSLLLRSAARASHEALASAALAGADLAHAHRSTPMAARTLGQQALPTSFGALVATWARPLAQADGLIADAVASLPVQYGGAAGTMAAVAPHGPAVATALARRLDLAATDAVWHTDRIPFLRVASAFAAAAGAVNKCATDIVAMSATELGEVSEIKPGGSSAMPHKRNPVAAIAARADSRRAPGLLATMAANTDHEFARAAGPWHAEWPTLIELARVTIGATRRLSDSLSGLQVHTDAMAHNLDATGGALMAERVVGALSPHTRDAREIVTSACAARTPLDTDERILAHLSADEIRRLLDPSGYLGHAPDLADAAVRDIRAHFATEEES
ncbi:lyase family protein [Gordonia jinhuaensis]|uniref:3-carboxymuconate cycloisomerase (PcaB) n=1 Tax=Gordonia jinhuaensis TaxID=1517702 RepID=A0A916TAY7_9ACTN|nr:lyase family protein [Gordonia jinhuaensis]GGB38288.1 putative 3-carboxymuconate cycloisomerase (PcaB) [Gordonia jinhuaensis]